MDKITRRDFVKAAAVGAVTAAGSGALACITPVGVAGVKLPLSEGYLVVDRKKCCGCDSCMLACSLVHEGGTNLSLSRIQIVQNSFGRFPDDIELSICRQCVNPLCVQSCPTGACHVDTANGNVRLIDASKCDGCGLCIQACPFMPHRTVMDPNKKKAIKCDLCTAAPFWNQKGGVNGKQACVEVCPMKAIKLVKEVPNQEGTAGYDVNLRNQRWGWLGLPTV